MYGLIVVRLVGAAASMGLPTDPDVFGEMTLADWLRARAKTKRARRRR